MKLNEIFNTKLILNWTFDVNEYYSEFVINEHKYGISVVEEEIENIKAIRIDFHFKNEDGTIEHNATNFGNDALKVLGIISNAIKEKFNHYEIIYFLAKKTSTDKEFSSRVKLYSRIIDKLKIELNMITIKHEFDNEYLFCLCKEEKDKVIVLQFL